MKRVFVAVALVFCLASAAAAQFGGGFGRFGPRGYPMKYASAESFGHGFNFCRAAYTSGRREAGGQGWSTDYPRRGAEFFHPPLGTHQDPGQQGQQRPAGASRRAPDR